MNEPVKVRERWVVRIDGKKRKFLTEGEAWDAIGGRPQQLEIEWIVEDKDIVEKSTKSGVFGSFFSSDEDLNS